MAVRLSSTAILLSSHTDSVNCITVCPYNPALVASGGDDKMIHLWNIQDLLCVPSSSSSSASSVGLKPIVSISTEDPVTALTFCNRYYYGSSSSSSSVSAQSVVPNQRNTTNTSKASTPSRKGSSKSKGKKKVSNTNTSKVTGNFDSDSDNERSPHDGSSNFDSRNSKGNLMGILYAGVGIRILEYRLYEKDESIVTSSSDEVDKEAATVISSSPSSSPSPSFPSTLTTSKQYTLEPGQRLQYNTDEISALVMHPTEPVLASSDDDGNIVLIQTTTNTLLRILRKGGHTSICSSVAFRSLSDTSTSSSSTSSTIELVSGGFDHNLICWNGTRGIPRSTLSVARTITLMMYTASSSSSEDTNNAASDNHHHHLNSNKSHAKASNGKLKSALTDSSNNTTGTDPANFAAAQQGKFFNPPFVHIVTFSPCNRYVVCSLGDGTISVCEWDSDGSSLVPLKPLWWKLEAHKSASTCLCFIEYPQPTPIAEAENSSSATTTTETSPVDSYLVSAGNDGWIQGWKWNDIIYAIKNRQIRTNNTNTVSSSDGSTDTVTNDSSAPLITFPDVPIAFRFRHGKGPNCLLPIKSTGKNGLLCVADSRNDIFVYRYDTIFRLSKRKSPVPSSTDTKIESVTEILPTKENV